MKMNRQEFLKLAGLLAASSVSFSWRPTAQIQDADAPNIILIVFDALSAKHLPFYGYPRQTMPELTQLLDRATVYHQHYAGSNFTTPGTASLLTGTYPWSHRALKLSDTIGSDFEARNVFALFEGYYRTAYTQNPVAEVLLDQFTPHISEHKPGEDLYLNTNRWIDRWFAKDTDTAWLSWNRFSDLRIDGLTYSLLFSEEINKLFNQSPQEFETLFPRGLPEYGLKFFLLERAMDWVQQQVAALPTPFLGYFHMLPPHDPYRTRVEFVDQFLEDGLSPPEKEFHHISPRDQNPNELILENRQYYDEFIRYVDAEFARFFGFMEREGMLENTYLMLTSDHGELFERGTIGHVTPHLYQPLVQIPLVIFEPGKKTRTDIYTPTSCTDVLPTLLHISGHAIPEWVEGEVLRPFSGDDESFNREVYAFFGRKNPEKYGELVNGTMMMVQNQFKAIRYTGYKNDYVTPITMKSDPWYEVYDLVDDPEELDNLAVTDAARVKSVIEAIEEKFGEIKKPYRG